MAAITARGSQLVSLLSKAARMMITMTSLHIFSPSVLRFSKIELACLDFGPRWHEVTFLVQALNLNLNWKASHGSQEAFLCCRKRPQRICKVWQQAWSYRCLLDVTKLHIALPYLFSFGLHWWCIIESSWARARWFSIFLEFHYGFSDSSVCYRNSEVWLYTGLWR